MSGSLESVLAQTVEHARQRKQFGKPISKFQAIQQQLAVLAGETAAAARACELAIEALEARGSLTEIAVAKARVGDAAGIGAEIAHQVHGAIGFTREHALHCYTRRLWSWRDEFGPEVYWQRELGREVARCGPAGLWPFLVYGEVAAR
jgi:acyl-CoA dehydrogenase